MKRTENPEAATGIVGEQFMASPGPLRYVDIKGPSFQTAHRNVGYRHDNGPAWNSRPEYEQFETPFGKVSLRSFPVNMYGWSFLIGDRIRTQGGAFVSVLKEASPAPNPPNAVPRGEVYVMGTHNYTSEKEGPWDGMVEVTLDQAVLNLLPVAQAALAAGAGHVTLGYTRNFAPTLQFTGGIEAEIQAVVNEALARLPSEEEVVEHPLLPGVRVPSPVARVLDARGLRDLSRCIWEGKGGSEVNEWVNLLTDRQYDWLSARVSPRNAILCECSQEFQRLREEWKGKPFPA